ncbi:alpha/beta fold hydrolase [Paraburkholderia sp. ZP32-5]|uniref:alpha/beta fold hydrolase n=1 Tax=Paraburkholderia sp. ZP32-5 TaxID=2883245 RepID=UPI001F3C3A8F|nr:alpha/beta hydrolase [Paraburkholderia sp. ZP32-5]
MTNWTTGVCEADGADIHYLRTGRALPPVVLLHGLMANGACWTPLARSLESEFGVVMPDARGHGKSTAPLSGYRYDDHASDVVAVIKQLELAAPILLGHSMGGMTAAVVASRFGTDIGGVILVDPTFLSPERQREVSDSDVAEQHRRVLGQNKDTVLADARRRHPRRSAEIVELQVDARLQTRMPAFDVLTPPNPDYRQLVSAIRVPILLVIGDTGAGAVVSHEVASELQRLNPRVRIEQIRDAGHGLPYDHPGRLAVVVKAFLKSIVAC